MKNFLTSKKLNQNHNQKLIQINKYNLKYNHLI